MVKVMETLWDESDDLNEESMLTNSVVSDTYMANDKEQLQDLKKEGEDDMAVVGESFKVEDNSDKKEE